MDATVYVRVRPFSQREENLFGELAVQTDNNNTSIILTNPALHEQSTTKVDKVYWSVSKSDANFQPNDTVVTELCSNIVNSVFNPDNAPNAVLFSYGVTGSGKTFLLRGNGDGYTTGVLDQLPIVLFEKMKLLGLPRDTVKVSIAAYEIFNEKIHDMQSAVKPANGLRIKEKEASVPYIENLKFSEANSAMEASSVISNAIANYSEKNSGFTYNQQGHSIFEFYVVNSVTKEEKRITLVELAGSEIRKLNGAYQVLNPGLVNLDKVISALKEKQQKKTLIPVRESKLTYVLKSTLVKGKNFFVCGISPSSSSYNDIKETLAFAEKVYSSKRVL